MVPILKSTLKALANSSPGLQQPWEQAQFLDDATLKELRFFAIANRRNSFRVAPDL